MVCTRLAVSHAATDFLEAKGLATLEGYRPIGRKEHSDVENNGPGRADRAPRRVGAQRSPHPREDLREVASTVLGGDGAVTIWNSGCEQREGDGLCRNGG